MEKNKYSKNLNKYEQLYFLIEDYAKEYSKFLEDKDNRTNENRCERYYKKVYDFVKQELDRAREEGYKKGRGKIDKSTPEQKEEWEEELGKLMSTWGKVLFVNKGRIGAGMQTAMYLKFYHFIKGLLLERERSAIETFLKDTASYNSFHNGRPRTMRNGLSGEGFEVRVSKLNKKK